MAVLLFSFTCTVHGKLAFSSKKKAKLHIRQHHTGERRINPFQCDAFPGMWHIGHLPPRVMQGRKRRTALIQSRIEPTD